VNLGEGAKGGWGSRVGEHLRNIHRLSGEIIGQS
jgi:hypothetical protein